MRKIFLGLLLLVGALAILPLFAAFEVHVVNVTAKIENALSLTAEALDFGTVFPQEHLAQQLDIALSSSFLAEPRVDDVNYFIRQKPKCAITSNDGTSFDPENTVTGQVIVNRENNTSNSVTRIDCGPPPRDLREGESWGVLPSLCEYLSKTGEENELLSFHKPWQVENSQVVWNDTRGYLAKSTNDISDTWTIDLAVPCFGGYCAQDWEDFVRRINAGALPAEQWVQPAENEHKIFGCDLWVEVTGVSQAGWVTPPPAEPVTIFSDDFGTGDTANDIPDWDEEGDDNASSTLARAPTATGNNTASPDGGRFARIGSGEWICRPVNATGFNVLMLQYYWRGDNDAENDSDLGLVEYATGGTCDSPTGLTALVAHELDDDPAAGEEWSSWQSINLPDAIDGTAFLLRFRNAATANEEDFRVDDVVLIGLAP
ncbi:MAG: hypothetical protein HYT46_02590 [Candidatus Vogelbacteria bacterium]|nr:hypothetical protein [Candidatus Vogelbacteria bacterium]